MGPGGNAFATDSATSELPTRYRQIGQYTIEMGSPLTAWCGGISGCVRKLIDGLFQLADIIAPLISLILTKLYSAKGSHCGWRSVYSVGKTAIKRRRIKMLFLGNVKERCQLRQNTCLSMPGYQKNAHWGIQMVEPFNTRLFYCESCLDYEKGKGYQPNYLLQLPWRVSEHHFQFTTLDC